MSGPVIAFLEYFAVSLALLVAFVAIYVRLTPYDDFRLIAHDNSAVAVTLAGAVLGFSLPLAAAVFYSESLVDVVIWGAVTCVVQLAVFLVLRRQARRIEEGHVSSAIMVAAFSVAIGLLCAVSISQ